MVKKLLIFLSSFVFLMPVMGNKPTQNLDLVQKKLKEAEISLENKESKKNKIERQLALIDSELSSYRIKIQKTNLEIQKNQKEINILEKKIKIKTEQIEKIKKQVADLLNYQYKHQYPNALVIIMQNGNLNDKTRNLEYLKYIQNTQRKSFSSLKSEQQELYILENSLQEKSNKLKQLAQHNRKMAKQVEIQRNKQIKLKNSIEIAIDQDKREIKTLQQSENRLNHLIRDLAKQQKQRQLVYQSKRKNNTLNNIHSSKKDKQVLGNLTQEDLHLTESKHASIIDSSESLVNSNFSRYKGLLRLPVREGIISQSYGQKRDDFGIVKGFVIRSPQNLPVFSVGDGIVVYRGVIPGYGSTVVIMHDNVYVTIYTGLSRINVSSDGERVKANTIIGETGVQYNGETGLYFELRENSRPINPKSWFK
ncbi:MAG: peptidoglycan DD-metalloendopeptidase family protein [Neisseriaceae bacterium]|nr:MAG: peptidoglycan DD-metalloendopeptidase family protein [Neisseriaceae bacterium]